MTDAPVGIGISYDPGRLTGKLNLLGTPTNAIWDRLQQSAVSSGSDYSLEGNSIELPWPAILTLIREYGRLQTPLNFRFRPDEGEAKARVQQFVQQYRAVQEARGQLTLSVSIDES